MGRAPQTAAWNDLEVTVKGKTTRLGPGSVAYVASGEHHGLRNAGTTRARYVVMALGRNT